MDDSRLDKFFLFLYNQKRMKLGESRQAFILKWGEMASHWGLNRTEAQIQALLFLSAEPLDAEEIAETLSVARSHVSNSLKELQRWGIVKVRRVIGNRRDRFESLQDVWDLFRTVVNEQVRREIRPWMSALDEASGELKKKKEDVYAAKKVAEMKEFFEIMSTWHEELNRLPTAAAKTFVKQGGRAIRLMGLKS
jgi:DNA-binding transcriptional regulator GbsR (MarR family)